MCTGSLRGVGDQGSKWWDLHSVQMQKPTSHPVVSALKICISSKRLRSEVRKKSFARNTVTKQTTRR